MSEGQEAVQGETKEQKFQRLATKRTQAALQKIRLITNLTSSSYAYTPEQAAKSIGSLRAAVDAVEATFNRVRGSQGGGDLVHIVSHALHFSMSGEFLGQELQFAGQEAAFRAAE